MKRSQLILRVAIVLVIIVVINLISNRLYLRLDLTEDNQFTLSEATESIVENLEDVVTVTAYFTEDLPPQLLSVKNDFLNMLIEYEQLSNGNLVFEFVNPNETQETEADAQQKGIRPIIVNVTESDQVQQLRAYMGAVIQLSDQTDIIPVVQPGASMEYGLTTGIKKLSVLDKPKLGLVQGHGEPSINGIAQLVQQLSVLYEVEPVDLAQPVSTYYKALLLINPTDTIQSSDFQNLSAYLNGGGNLFVTYGNIIGDLNQQQFLSPAPNIGVFDWLAQNGINFGNQILVDANSATIGVQQQQGSFIMTSQVRFPYFPIISDFSDHPASKGIESLVLQFVSPLSASVDSTTISTVLARSSENSGTESLPAYIDINRKWSLSDFGDEGLPVAIALENLNNTGGKLVVVGNGDFIINGEGQQAQQVNQDNINFASNIIDWLSDDTGLVALRTKGVTNRPLDQLEDGQKSLIKWGNLLSPILVILIYAFVRKQQHLRKKQNWLQGNY